MSSENFFIKSEELNAQPPLPLNAMTQNFIDVRRQNKKFRLQNPYADS